MYYESGFFHWFMIRTQFVLCVTNLVPSTNSWFFFFFFFIHAHFCTKKKSKLILTKNERNNTKKKKRFLMMVTMHWYQLRFRDTKSNILKQSKRKRVVTKLFTSLTNVYVWLIFQETIYFYGHESINSKKKKYY